MSLGARDPCRCRGLASLREQVGLGSWCPVEPKVWGEQSSYAQGIQHSTVRYLTCKVWRERAWASPFGSTSIKQL